MMTNDLRERVAARLEDIMIDAGDTPISTQELASTLADAAIAEVGGVKVKPLQWTQIGDGKGRDIYSTIHWANSPYGSYYIGLQPRGGNPFDWSGPNNSGKRKFGSMDEAKSTAQADYEARILTAIEPAPVSAQRAALKAQIHRLTAAGDNLTAWVDERGTSDVHKWDKARDEAFRALAEGKDND